MICQPKKSIHDRVSLIQF